MESFSKISLQKIMNHSLASTAHALQSGDFMKHAFWHPYIFHRIEKIIKKN